MKKPQNLTEALLQRSQIGILGMIRLNVRNKRLTELEHNFHVLERARTLIDDESIQNALSDIGVPQATEFLSILDAQNNIVLALHDGQEVQASPNPFQKAGLYYIAQSDILPKNATQQHLTPQAPAWDQQPQLSPEPEYIPPPPLPERRIPTPTPQTQSAPIQSTPIPPETPPQPTPTPLNEIPTSPTAPEQLQTDAAFPSAGASTSPAQPSMPTPTPAVYEEAQAQAPAIPPLTPTPQPAPAPTPAPPIPAPPIPAPPIPAPLIPAPPIPAPLTPAPAPQTALPGAPDLAESIHSPATSLPGYTPIRAHNDPTPKKKTAPQPPTRRSQKRMNIGEALMQLGVDIDTSELSDPRLEQKLLKQERIGEETAQRAIALSCNLTYIDVIIDPPHPDCLNLIDEKTAVTMQVYPHHVDPIDQTFYVLTSKPHREALLRTAINERTNLKVQLLITTRQALERLISEGYTSSTNLAALHEEFSKNKTQEVELDESSGNAVHRWLLDKITSGVSRNASDIHFEPTLNGLRVRYRIDGKLRTDKSDNIPKESQDNIIRVIKLMADMDLGNNRAPQDSRIALKQGRNKINMRASSLPQTEGHEKIVLRILKEAKDIPDIENLNMSEQTLERFRYLISRPDGIVLVTGPTGSGKSFTLYSALKKIATEDKNVQTLEDPVEYELPTLNQSQINEDAGFSFARALRSAMRQDPDIILVGEIRDLPTAEVSVAAANTGHLLLSTLHANTAVSAIQRLRTIGVPDYNIAPALRGVITQRLIPSLCPKCALSTPLPQRVKDNLQQAGIHAEDHAKTPNRQGCPACEGGYKGRTPIHELLVIDDHIQDLISNHATINDIQQAAQQQGMRDLLTDGYLKAAQGLIAIEDVESRVNTSLDLTDIDLSGE